MVLEASAGDYHFVLFKKTNGTFQCTRVLIDRSSPPGGAGGMGATARDNTHAIYQGERNDCTVVRQKGASSMTRRLLY